jgi:hypothetical protein
MIVASAGVAVGALYSSGMMEIARSGIFTPSMFSFDDVMIIFLSGHDYGCFTVGCV